MRQSRENCIKKPKFYLISWGENFVEAPVSVEFWMNHSKLCGNCEFPQNFHNRKLGAISVLYAVEDLVFANRFPFQEALTCRKITRQMRSGIEI